MAAANNVDKTNFFNTNLGVIGKTVLNKKEPLKSATLKDYASVVSAKTFIGRLWKQFSLLHEGKGWINENSIKKVQNANLLSHIKNQALALSSQLDNDKKGLSKKKNFSNQQPYPKGETSSTFGSEEMRK